MVRNNLLSIDNVDRTAAIAGAIVSIMLLAFLIVRGSLVYQLVGAFTFIACVSWLLLRKRAAIKPVFVSSVNLGISLKILYFTGFILSLLSLYYRSDPYGRPTLFFMFVGLMAAVIFIEILFNDEKKYTFILMQILMLGLLISWSGQLLFPDVIGNDPWWHRIITLEIIDTHFIPTDQAYAVMPVFHLLSASVALLSTLNYKLAVLLSSSFLDTVGLPVLTFLLGKSLLSNKVGLLASLLLTLANYPLLLSITTIPNSLATPFVLVILYLLFSMRNRREHNVSYNVLVVLFMMAVLLTHSISSLWLAMLLLLSWASYRLYSRFYRATHAPVAFNIALLFVLLLLLQWVYTSTYVINILAFFLERGFRFASVFADTPGLILDYYRTVPIVEQMLLNLGSFLFFALALPGIFYMTSKKGNGKTFTFAVLGFFTLCLLFITIMFGVYIINERWFYFSEILLSIPLAASVLIVVSSVKKINVRLIAATGFIFVFGFAILMTLGPPSIMDNFTLAEDLGITFSLKQSEIQSKNVFANFYDDRIGSDRYIVATECEQMPYKFLPLDDDLYKKEFGSYQLMHVRDAIVGQPFLIYQTCYRLDYDLLGQLDQAGLARIYDSNTVKGYFNVTR